MVFSRNVNTGEDSLYGEILMQSQGEDVVSGDFTPQPICALKRVNEDNYRELERIRKELEREWKDMVDIEFTIMDGKVYIL